MTTFKDGQELTGQGRDYYVEGIGHGEGKKYRTSRRRSRAT